MIKLRFILKLFKITLVLIFVYLEFFTYFILPLKWPKQVDCQSSNCVKILLVADPQILGEQDSNNVARWDCDRFLRRTFDFAFNYVQPEIIVFLGDLMDEGHISSDQHFQSDLKRFRSTFDIPEDIITIHVPGDNDVGGEGDPILPQIVHRFDKEFDFSTEPITFQNLEFYKVNKMTQMFQEPEIFNEDQIRIALSHMPILRKIHTFTKEIAKSVKPQIIFSGHDHQSAHITATNDDPWRKTIDVIDHNNDDWIQYQLQKNVIHEINVPTCSYRMGMLHMGYGYAVVDQSKGILTYSVLWLPQRLIHLFIYLGIAIVVVLLGICYGCCVCKRRVQKLTRAFHLRKQYTKV